MPSELVAAEVTGADFVAAIFASENMNIGTEKAEFGYQKNASVTVVLGAEADSEYQLSAIFSSNAGYVYNSAVTKVFVDGVEVTSFPQTNNNNAWSAASGTLNLTEGNHQITLTINTAWNDLSISGLKLENLNPAETFVNNATAVVDGTTITMSGKVGAEWMDLKYGVEFSANKAGTRAQKYYGAKSGDTVGDYNGSTEFTFGDWDGSFEIILEGVSTGEKTYKFFVGDNYTEEATLTVEAAAE